MMNPAVSHRIHPCTHSSSCSPAKRSTTQLSRLLSAALCAAFLHSIPVTASGPSPISHKQWPQWRGPLLNGVAPLSSPPLRWSETENVKWKWQIPGFGTSTPIIWEDRVFILTAVPSAETTPPVTPPRADPAAPADQRRAAARGRRPSPADLKTQAFTVFCLDRPTGRVLWSKVAREEKPHEGHHQDHGFASASPVTDGNLLIASFGSRGIYCYDLDGNLKWEKDLGDMMTRNGFGEGSSPALHGNYVVVLWDHEGEDFIVALDKHTGKELWRQVRDEPTGWSTPLIVEHNGQPQVVVNGTGKVRGYDLATGKPLWESAGQTVNAIPTPVSAEGVVFVTSGFRGSALHAIKLGQTGDLTGTDAILWSHKKSTPYVPSPLLVDSLLYVVADNNPILSNFDAKTGKLHFDAQRLDSLRGIYASPVAAQDRVYVLGRDGTCVVLKKGPTLEVLATNKIDDRTDSSIALVGNELFIRGHQSLYCIAEK